MKSFITLTLCSAALACSTTPPHEGPGARSLEPQPVLSTGSNLHYAGSASSGLKEDLSRRLVQFQEHCRVGCGAGLEGQVDPAGAKYMGYSYVEMLGEDGQLDVWLMVMGDSIPRITDIRATGGGRWGLSEDRSFPIGQDAFVYLVEANLETGIRVAECDLGFSISMEDGRSMEWEI